MDIRNRKPLKGCGAPCAPFQPPLSTPQCLPFRELDSLESASSISRLVEALTNVMVQQNAILSSIDHNLERIANALNPELPDVVGTPYVAKRLGQTTTWIAEMARRGEIPKSCLVAGTGTGKPWKFHRAQIDNWIENR